MSTTTLLPSPGSHEESLAHSKTISRAALVALVLGLFSALTLVSLLLAFIPLLTIVLGALSLRSIRASEGRVVGAWPAAIGVCMATFFLGWSVTQSFSRELTLEGHGRRFAEAWLALVAKGDLQQAHQMMVPAHNRILSAELRKEFYEKNPKALEELNTLFSRPPLNEFIAQGPAVPFRFDTPAGGDRTGYQDRVVLKYLFDRSDGSSQPLWITVRREYHVEEGHADWEIENIVGEERVNR
jgi:hypothetical protein